ncbi:RecT protein [Methylobacterium sp. 4-46]|uniref:recombinase RecT n=1 Tax=unclassified Methylobacterium TaxID=2615210 RepID=UPI000152DB46|nr:MULTISPECIES: recombinase RecT [Methylobacterium]ACA18433.1 RecT protein [Methylobacterium sp. 4-46]WFT77725.1 recombinase RecT [Methylobacterium nodulans]
MAASTAVAERPHNANPLVVVREQIQSREAEFAAALPAHIPVERFKRVLLTAVQNNPDLLKLERRSFFNAAMRAAQDGLLPDGREGAIVEFSGRAQWMPMIAGIRKKVRNSGEIATWEANVVFENDHFEYQLGDEPKIVHVPVLVNRGKPVAAYSIAVLKSGERSREVMTVEEIEKVRKVSRAKSGGPWSQWWEEMARKTVARRHSKVLPLSSDLDDLMRRDDELYDFNRRREQQDGQVTGIFQPVANPLADTIEHQPGESGETVAADLEEEAQGTDEDEAGDKPGAAQPDPADDFPGNDAIAAGRRSARREG